MKPKGFHVAAQGKRGEVWIYEDIGEGWLGGLSAKRFADEIKALGKVSHITVHLNSAGGSVFDGTAIYNTLRKHPARVEVEIDGLAASIASIIALAGDEVRMAANGFFMIHNPWVVAAGTALELREMATTLDKVQGQLLKTYCDRTGLGADVVGAMMDAETWMTAEEALAQGFIDGVAGEIAVAAFAHVDMQKFKRAPSALVATAQAACGMAGRPRLAARQARLHRMQLTAKRMSPPSGGVSTNPKVKQGVS
ncbi:head maturation protease, ClpP-related [Megalodesulfovibrio gigas]|uniref:ATP-dependent Clp protease proteolytic subunit n=1 Tax=Megalodesulfovibrio gigas (strain ATCC 19364 / DSM 1382 / NCIMB 9332 / VKM B-1759) TaxID=1121448 RepID=T2GBZ0_MEGG1|nr:head maturation protease, ClpP-related [Megalodesulfovibrio gigas]AGW13823.1 putative peptidase S14 ClpP [Megalodesulfovibrio gigas DSM 1382 = ATCC 19364]